MRLLVTGGAGFLGSHLAYELLKMNHEVIVLDNLYTGREENIDNLRAYGAFTFIQQDVQTIFDIEVEGIFNLACPASPVHYQKDPIRTVRTNVQGAINVLDLAHKNNARVLQASTSEIYGDPTQNPQSENYWGNVNPVGIRSCYDEGKRVAETLFSDYHRQYGTDIRIARIFNTYGPRMSSNDGRVVSNLICQAIKGEPITIYGDGEQIRSFCYVSDLIRGLISLFFSDPYFKPINLGNPEPVTIKNLAKKIISKTNSNSNLEFMPLPEDDPLAREPDISCAGKVLGWKPEIKLDSGLDKTIDFFEKEVHKE